MQFLKWPLGADTKSESRGKIYFTIFFFLFVFLLFLLLFFLTYLSKIITFKILKLEICP